MCQHFYAQPGKYPLDLAEMDSEPVQQKLVVNAVNALGSNVLIRHAAVKKALRITQIGWVKVRLPGREEHLSLVVSRLAGCDTLLMLLTNLPVESAKDAERVLRHYIRRWECEEAIRFLKSQVNLEKIRTFSWRAIERLVLLAVLVMVYLGWVTEERPAIAERLIYLSQPLPDEPEFIGYRLLAGLIEAVNTCFWLHKDLLRRPL